MWGAVGWGGFSPLAGLLATRYGLPAPFLLSIAVGALGFALVFALPFRALSSRFHGDPSAPSTDTPSQCFPVEEGLFSIEQQPPVPRAAPSCPREPLSVSDGCAEEGRKDYIQYQPKRWNTEQSQEWRCVHSGIRPCEEAAEAGRLEKLEEAGTLGTAPPAGDGGCRPACASSARGSPSLLRSGGSVRVTPEEECAGRDGGGSCCEEWLRGERCFAEKDNEFWGLGEPAGPQRGDLEAFGSPDSCLFWQGQVGLVGCLARVEDWKGKAADSSGATTVKTVAVLVETSVEDLNPLPMAQLGSPQTTALTCAHTARLPSMGYKAHRVPGLAQNEARGEQGVPVRVRAGHEQSGDSGVAVEESAASSLEPPLLPSYFAGDLQWCPHHGTCRVQQHGGGSLLPRTFHSPAKASWRVRIPGRF